MSEVPLYMGCFGRQCIRNARIMLTPEWGGGPPSSSLTIHLLKSDLLLTQHSPPSIGNRAPLQTSTLSPLFRESVLTPLWRINLRREYRGTWHTDPPPPQKSTVALCLGTYGGLSGGGSFL